MDDLYVYYFFSGNQENKWSEGLIVMFFFSRKEKEKEEGSFASKW